uniref:Uncharacterized protein n=1 Tax=Picea glauca TaxID=3330 RepID=A0A101LW31_PICGL|nr:hypothetical protein ABT39_MTgene1522 [Picea glauca]
MNISIIYIYMPCQRRDNNPIYRMGGTKELEDMRGYAYPTPLLSLLHGLSN